MKDRFNEWEYPIPLSSPDIIEKDIEAVVGVMKTRYLSIGPKVVEFEKRMSSFTGTKRP
ncbi:hypothetical protein ES708_23194 [subsurface metagenome]